MWLPQWRLPRPDTSVIILDACRDNPFGRGGARGLAKLTPPQNSLIVYAADAGESASDGLFTPTLLKYLTQPGWSLDEVLMKTRTEVRESSRNKQRPGEYSMLEEKVYLAGQTRCGRFSRQGRARHGVTIEKTYGALKVGVQTTGELYLDGQYMATVPGGQKAALESIPTGTHEVEMRIKVRPRGKPCGSLKIGR